MLTTTQAAEILVVRAVEEEEEEAGANELIAPAERVDALTAAGDLDDEIAWLARRATFLLDHSAAPYRAIVAMTAALERFVPLLGLAPFAIGLSSNYLGPAARIHVIANPIALLVTWNALVYVALFVGRLRVRRRPPAAALAPTATLDGAPTAPGEIVRPQPPRREPTPADAPPRASWLARWAVRRLVPAAWLALHRTAGDAGVRANAFAGVARRFWRHWTETAAATLGASARRAAHVGAVALALGALAGMYVRGLFFEYNVVWRSTFVRAPETVSALLAALFGPGALLVGAPLPDAAEATRLMAPEGVAAARWIHLYAVTTGLVIVAPRIGLAALAAIRRRQLGRRLVIDKTAPYFERVLSTARALQRRHIEDAIAEDVRRECGRFAESVAAFVCEDLYDARIAARLAEFRREGGALAALEDTIVKDCRGFEPKLARRLPALQSDFERALSASIERTIGADLAVVPVPARAIARGVGTVAGSATKDVARRVGHRLADVAGGAVSSAIALTAATVSGGLGKSLGTAILVGLLGTSGPVGFLVGGIGGLVIATFGWWLGRDALAERLKRVALPALVVRTALMRFGALVDDGRERCRAAVAAVIDRELEPLRPEIAAQVWQSVKPVLGARQRREGR
jgi:hypothetical protein